MSRRSDDVFDALDAIPTPTFVLDADLRVVHQNAAARTLAAARPGERAGDRLGCAAASPDGCGRADGCATCPLKGAVSAALGTGGVVRLRAVLAVRTGLGTGPAPLLVSAAPAGRRAGHVVLNVEDVTELTALRALWSSVTSVTVARRPRGRDGPAATRA